MDHPNRSDTGPTLPPLSKWLRWAIWARWVLLGCYVLLSGMWYFIFLSASDPLGLSPQPSRMLGPFVIGTLVLLGVQFLFLRGAPQLHWPRPRRRRSIFVSLAAGAAIAVMLSLGVVCACMSLNQLLFHPDSFDGFFANVQSTPTPAAAPATAPAAGRSSSPPAVPAPSPPFNWRADVPWGLIGLLLAGWTFWFLIFALLGGGEWTQRFRRMYRTLIAGTVLELLITIPIDAQVRRRTHCYCGEGTFYAMAIGLTAVLWTFGPGVAILFLIRRQQRMASGGRCLQCGYDLRGLDSPRCPECGLPFGRALASEATG